MLYSMTGFGKTQTTIQDILVQIELRTLNSKGLDVNIRMPLSLKQYEIETRNIFSKQLIRGKVDAFFNLDLPVNLQVSEVNQEVVSAYLSQLEPIISANDLTKEGLLTTILQLPNALSTPEQELEDAVWEEIKSVLIETCEKVNAFRKREGQTMEVKLVESIDIIGENLLAIPQYEAERVEKVKERMVSGLMSIKDQVEVDQNKLEQELVFYIEKFDITEEKVRLTAHLAHFIDLIKDETVIAKGKKLNFISQEIGREINTIGSKANHLEIQKLVVNMKDQLEQIKEQLSNIL